MKFGGASIATPSGAKTVSDIINKSDTSTLSVIVFSAIDKTSSNILKAAKLSSQGKTEPANNIINTLRELHISFVAPLANQQIKDKLLLDLGIQFDELSDLINDIVHSEHFLKDLDRVLSFGEICSSLLMAATLEDSGINICVIDTIDIIKTDNNYSKAIPLHEHNSALIQRAILPVIKAGKMVITQGFIGSTITGQITTLGFEGSDYTATILGSALDCQEVQLWKTVAGIMSTDPNMIESAHTVPAISYIEAKELSVHGASCLHPKTMEPVQTKAIPVRILNVLKPGDKGTLISDRLLIKKEVKSIAYKYNTGSAQSTSKVAITLVGEGVLFDQKFIDEMRELLSDYTIEPVSGSEVVISLTFITEAIMLLEVLNKVHEYLFSETNHPESLFSIN